MSSMIAVPPVRSELRHKGGHVRLVLDRPRGNIITSEMIAALREAVGAVPLDGALKLLTIEGAGTDFSFGASVEEHLPDRVRPMLAGFHALIRELLAVPVTTAAIVRGRCLGGGFELALACDFIFAAEDAVLGCPEILLGVFPPAAAALLPARVGTARAMHAIVTGRGRPAPEWNRDGLLACLAPAGQLGVEVDRLYETHLATKSSVALRHAVAAVRSGIRSHVDGTLDRLERLYLDRLMQTADAVEGVSAFLEKRPPRWSHR